MTSSKTYSYLISYADCLASYRALATSTHEFANDREHFHWLTGRLES